VSKSDNIRETWKYLQLVLDTYQKATSTTPNQTQLSLEYKSMV